MKNWKALVNKKKTKTKYFFEKMALELKNVWNLERRWSVEFIIYFFWGGARFGIGKQLC